jgi:hypothetical protein
MRLLVPLLGRVNQSGSMRSYLPAGLARSSRTLPFVHAPSAASGRHGHSHHRILPPASRVVVV